jgi:hypothetical protein
MSKIINSLARSSSDICRPMGIGRWLVVWVFAGSISLPAAAQGVLLYRYVNEEGVKVIHHTIPPEYAQKGYEVLNSHGNVVRVVEPSLTTAELAALARQRELDAWDKDLLKRYSTVSDVKSAKKRRLNEINTNIAILRGTILNLDSQIAREQSRAADTERQGVAVPEAILINIRNFREEKSVAQQQVEERRQEYEEEEDKFDRDIDRFSFILERREQARSSY